MCRLPFLLFTQALTMFGWHIVFLVLPLELVFNRTVLNKEGKDESVNPSESHSFAVVGPAFLCK